MSSNSSVQDSSYDDQAQEEDEEVLPTIFDVLSQENMHSLFQSSFNHVFTWVARYSRKTARLERFKDEIYLGLHSLVELAYLKIYNALFSEYFYGLKRANLNSNRKRLLSIVFSIIVPYLKTKMDDFYEELERSTDEEEPRPDQNKFKRVVFKLILKFYPYFHLLWSATFWVYRFRFMLNKSDSHSPLLKMLNLKLVYDLDRENSTAISEKAISWPNYLFKSIASYTSYGFTGFLFFIQFLEWHEQYNTDESYGNNLELTSGIKPLKSENDENGDDDILHPPELSVKLENNKTLKRLAESGLCPLCTKKRTNACVLSVSGLVFCYPCIFKFIKENNRCPLTNFPCSTSHIIRIYTSSD